VHDKLVARHPHVFGDVVAEDAATVARNWEEIKKAEKGRTSVTEGIPSGLPALAYAATLQRKAASFVPKDGGFGDSLRRARLGLEQVGGADPDTEANQDAMSAIAEVLWWVTDLARRLGVDAEEVLRTRARVFRAEVQAREG
jgi:uncharacterized protein YabN with tetrapyrrole methylase and pyrophosphatase domain